MKIILFSVLLAIMQGAQSVPRQTVDNPAGSRKGVQVHKHAEQGPATAPMPVTPQATTAREQDATSQPSKTNTQERVVVIGSSTPVDSVWWNRFYVIFTGLLALIGAFGVIYAGKTLKNLSKQTQAMMNAERAWVIGHPELWSPEIRACWEQGDPITTPEEMRGWVHLFNARIKNVGNTPAQIDEVSLLSKLDFEKRAAELC